MNGYLSNRSDPNSFIHFIQMWFGFAPHYAHMLMQRCAKNSYWILYFLGLLFYIFVFPIDTFYGFTSRSSNLVAFYYTYMYVFDRMSCKGCLSTMQISHIQINLDLRTWIISWVLWNIYSAKLEYPYNYGYHSF